MLLVLATFLFVFHHQHSIIIIIIIGRWTEELSLQKCLIYFPITLTTSSAPGEGGGGETTMPWYMVNEIKLATEHWFTVIGRLIIDPVPG